MRTFLFLLLFSLLSILSLGLCGDEKFLRVVANPDSFESFHLLWAQMKKEILNDLSRISGNLLSYQQIQFRGHERYTEADLRKTLRLNEGNFVFARPPGAIAQDLTRVAWIEQAQVKTSFFPLRLQLEVKEATPWLVAEVSGRSWLLSKEGKMLQALEDLSNPDLLLETTELPRLRGIENAARLMAASDQIRTLETSTARSRWDFAWAVEEYGLHGQGALEVVFSSMSLEAMAQARVESEEIAKTLRERPFLKLLLFCRDETEAKESLSRLKSVVADLQLRGEVAEVIDLRFENQAVINKKLTL